MFKLPPKGGFSTIILHDQFYGEVPPQFLQSFYSELQHKWHLWDDNETKHTVTFDKNHIVPYLTNGWFALVNVFDIQQPKEIKFLYYGGKTFRISIKNSITTTDQYPHFHSLSTKPHLTSYFDLILSSRNAAASDLTLQKPFGKFLRDNFYNTVQRDVYEYKMQKV
ncbi:hypothetical protein QL285_065675 [Trifolium repens]|nr:hypothetical protein QL285_065675 [Trifolium repens]